MALGTNTVRVALLARIIAAGAPAAILMSLFRRLPISPENQVVDGLIWRFAQRREPIWYASCNGAVMTVARRTQGPRSQIRSVRD